MASKTRDERIAELQKQEVEIQARLKRLRSQDAVAKRKLDTRRKIITGAAIMLEQNEDPSFDQRVKAIIEKRVKAPRDRAVFGLPSLEPGP